MASAPTRPLEVPPYHLQLLVDSVLDDFADIINASSDPRNPPTTVRCAQALGALLTILLNLRLLTNCGIYRQRPLRRLRKWSAYSLRAARPPTPLGPSITRALEISELTSEQQPAGYRLVSQYMMPGNKPVDEIALAPGVGKMLVQTGEYGCDLFQPRFRAACLPATSLGLSLTSYHDHLPTTLLSAVFLFPWSHVQTFPEHPHPRGSSHSVLLGRLWTAWRRRVRRRALA